MNDELEAFLYDFAMNEKMSPQARMLAGRLHGQLMAGIMPSLAKIRKLKKHFMEAPPCGRLHDDGSCAWLRRNARTVGLRSLKPGETAFCKRKATGTAGLLYIDCPGYTKVEDPE